MSLAAPRFFEPRHLAIAGVFALAVVTGTLAGIDPKLAIAASLGLAFVLVALADLAIGVAIFGVLTFLELSPVAGGPAVSFAKVAGLTLAISWLAIVASDRGRDRMIFSVHPGMTVAMLAFIAWAALSCAWAEDPSVALSTVGRYALNIALIPIVYTAIRTPTQMRWIASSISIGAVLAAAYGLLAIPSASGAADSITAAGDLNRISGTVGDPNLLASVLVVGLVMSLVISMDDARTPLTRILGVSGGLLCLAAVIATVSRGGVVALVAALIAAVVFAGRKRTRVALGVAAVAVFTVGLFALLATDAQRSRLTEADGGSGRTDIWQIGWRMVEDKPITGVGAGNFNVSSIHYLLVEPGAVQRDEFIVDTPQVAHNLYLDILAETGVVGLGLFLAIVAISIATAIRAARAFEERQQDGLAWIARGAVIGIVSTLAADFFLSAEFSKLLWLLLSLGPAMLAVALSNPPRDAAASLGRGR